VPSTEPASQDPAHAEAGTEKYSRGQGPFPRPIRQHRNVIEPHGLVKTVTSRETSPLPDDSRYAAGSADERDNPPTVEPFEDFMRRERELVVGLLYGLTRDWYAAEDLAQNAFVAAQRHWPRVSRMDKPGAWLRKVAINGQRRWRRRGLLEAEALARKFLLGNDEPVALPTEHAELWDAVWRLPRGQLEVVVLHYQSDIAVDEIAEILGIRDGTVKSRLHYARKTLAEWLGDHDERGLV
jgi:RNA polymerase sigma factor (sigma-70 family)